jgi:hypothetical protein
VLLCRPFLFSQLAIPVLDSSQIRQNMSATNVISLLSWGNVVGAIVAYYGTLVFYRLFLHPLARFPGPRLAAISRWYEGYYDVVQRGQYTLKIAELHKKYGGLEHNLSI